MNGEYYINTFNCEAVLDRIFFVSQDMNLILRYSLDKDEITLLPPPDEKMFGIGLYGNVVAFDDLIYVIPFNSRNIWKFCDIGRWEKFTVSGTGYRRFLGAVPFDKYIYLLGFGRKEIYKFNISTHQIIELQIDIKLEMLEIEAAGFLGSDYEIVNGRIFVPVMCANKILEIDPETDLINIIDVPGRSNGYSGIIYDENGFWLAPRKGRYFVHYLLNGKVEEYELPNDYKKDGIYFGGAYREGDYIIFTAFCGKNFKFKTKTPDEYEVFEPSIYYCKKLNNKGKVIHERNGKTYYIDLDGNIKKLNLSISSDERLEYIGRYTDSKRIITEGKELLLNEYLGAIGYGIGLREASINKENIAEQIKKYFELCNSDVDI